VLDREAALRDARRGLRPGEIAAKQGVQRTTVWRFLVANKHEIEQHADFVSRRADLLAGIQRQTLRVQQKLVEQIERDLDKGVTGALKPSQKAVLLNALNNVQGTVYDKERLERGKSTSNVSVLSRMMDQSVKSIHSRNSLKRLEPGAAASGESAKD
jgi:hypothetical protein